MILQKRSIENETTLKMLGKIINIEGKVQEREIDRKLENHVLLDFSECPINVESQQ